MGSLDPGFAAQIAAQADLTRERLLGMAEGRMLSDYDRIDVALAKIRLALDRIERARAVGADPRSLGCDPARLSAEAVAIADQLTAAARHPEQQERAA